MCFSALFKEEWKSALNLVSWFQPERFVVVHEQRREYQWGGMLIGEGCRNTEWNCDWQVECIYDHSRGKRWIMGASSVFASAFLIQKKVLARSGRCIRQRWSSFMMICVDQITPSSRNNTCWQEMLGGLAGHWATLGFSLFSLHFMSSSLPRPNVFLLVFSKKYLSLSPNLFTVVTGEGTLWASPGRAPILGHPDSMQMGGPRTHTFFLL